MRWDSGAAKRRVAEAARRWRHLVEPRAPEYASEQDLECPPGTLNRDDMLSLAFKFAYGNRISGDYFEFGCFGARTFRMAWRHSRKPYERGAGEFWKPVHLWAFDSFEGLPEARGPDDVPFWNRGDFAITQDDFHRVVQGAGIPPSGYTVVPGFYEQSLTRELQEKMSGVVAAVVFIDCDFYESTRSVLAFLPPFLQQGTLLCFDDFHLFAAADDRGQRRAVAEFVAAAGAVRLEPYRDFGWHGRSFIVHVH